MIHLVIFLSWILLEVICFVYYFFKFSKISDNTEMGTIEKQNKQWSVIGQWVFSSIALIILAIVIATGV